MCKNRLNRLLNVIFLSLSFSIVIFAGDNDWRPVTPEELGQKAPKVEADADAEAIFWEVKVDDSGEGVSLKHYIRVKIFTERGREKFSKIDIPFRNRYKVKDVAARVVKPDGSIVELKKEEIFERDIIKVQGAKLKAKSFAVAGIETGVIFEYRYREVLDEGGANNMRMIFQRDLPIQNMTYYLKPTDQYNTQTISFNMNNVNFTKDKGGYYRATLLNVPAIKDEPNMPPEDEVRSWTFVLYSLDSKFDAKKYWSNAGFELAQDFDIKDALKPGGDIKKALPGIIGDTTDDNEKLKRIYDFCRTKLKNITFDPTITDEDRAKIKFNSSPSDTLKKQQGRSLEINDVFASLAVAAGFEARLMFAGDRSEIFFTYKHAHSSFVHPAGVAVRTTNPFGDLKLGKDVEIVLNGKDISIGGNWQFFKPGNPFVEPGNLAWYEENQTAFLLGSKSYITLELPLMSHEKSKAKRIGKFKLLEDGTLEGDVRIEYSGHFGYQYKANNYDDSPTKREETLKEEVKARMSAADLTNISIENIDNYSKPFVYNYKVKVPNYAQKTGKRLFLQPGFFEYGETPQFTSATRTYPIYFNFPWSEDDDISIELPAGYSLDNPDAPGGLTDTDKITSLTFDIKVDNANRKLFYKRNLYFGGKGKILFPAGAYPAIKNMFDSFHKADSHIITLKQN
jgi:Domain of Unknown Function with PDB structure (DUF3857)/Transglutaminase-like superfamily